MSDVYKIQNNDFTILLERPDGNGNFGFYGLIVNNNPDVIYLPYVSEWTKKEEGKIYISLYHYINDKVKKQADVQLKEYIDKNINNQDFYTKKFFRNHLFADGELPIVERDVRLYLDGIGDGIVYFKINSCYSGKYDIMQDKIIMLEHSYDNKEVTLLDVFYGDYLNYIIAVEQYNRGIAHKTFTEIVNLNKFLKGKKSIKIVLKDGRIFKLKKDIIKAYDILSIIGDKFFINDSYYFKPRLNERVSLSELDYLQYGKMTYKINVENLIIK